MPEKTLLLAFSEAKPKNFRIEKELSEYIIDGYEIIPLNMNKSDAGRGMMVYVSNTLKYTVVELYCNFEEYISVEMILNKTDK